MILIMSLANIITLSRGALIVPILLLLFSGHRTAALVLFLFASAGDILDGLVARARGEVTTWGKVLDPLMDKALYLSLLSSLYVFGEISLVALILFLAPQVGMALGALLLRVRDRIVQSAKILGKAAAVLSFGALVFLLAGWPGGAELLYVAIGLTYVATADYAWSAWSKVRQGRAS